MLLSLAVIYAKCVPTAISFWLRPVFSDLLFLLVAGTGTAKLKAVARKFAYAEKND